jgi:hypothetical protein
MQFASAPVHSSDVRNAIVRAALLLLLLLLSGSLVACGGNTATTETDTADTADTADTDTADTDAADTDAADTDAAGESNEATLVIINDSAEDTICQVYFSRTTNDEWENNRLGLFSSLEPGASESFEVDADMYDIRMEDCDHNLLLQELEMDVTGEYEVRYAGRGETDAVLTISNDAQTPICWVYFSSSDSMEWGGDQLGVEQTLDPGNSRSFEVASDTYDILLADCEENTLLEEYEVEITDEYTLTYSE